MNEKLLTLLIRKLESIKLPNPTNQLRKKLIYSTSAKNAGRQAIAHKPDVSDEVVDLLKELNKEMKNKSQYYTILSPSIYASKSILKYLISTMTYICKDKSTDVMLVSWITSKKLDKLTDQQFKDLLVNLDELVDDNDWILDRSNWIKPKLTNESGDKLLNKFLNLL